MRRDITTSLSFFLGTLALDQISKRCASPESVQYNPGLIFGLGVDLPALLRLVALCSFFGFIFFAYLCCLYLLPTKVARMKYGLSLFVGGIAGNVVDKAILGSTADFLPLPLFGTQLIFNLADVFQWVGAALIAYQIAFHADLLWFPENNRGSYLVRPREQLWFSLKFASIAFCCSLLLGLFSYTFLRLALENMPERQAQGVILAFGLTHLALSLLFTLLVFLVGILISHRSYGPLYAFELYVEDLLKGEDRALTLRDGDNFQQLMDIGAKLRHRIQKK